MKKEISNFLFLSLILTAIVTLPSIFGEEDLFTSLAISAVCNLLFLLYIGNNCARSGLLNKERQQPFWKHILILSPTIVMFLALPISMLFPDAVIMGSFSDVSWLYLLNGIVSVINEELIFRLMFQTRIFAQSRLKRILVSAGIYALFDIIVLFRTFNLIATIITMIGSFILGIVLGFIMEYGHSIYPCIVFHLLYEFFTNLYVVVFVVGSIDTTFLSLGLMVLTLAYLAITYILYFRKKEF